MSGQKPLKQRCQETMELLWKREQWGLFPDRVDKQVLKRLIKDGRAKIINGNGRAPLNQHTGRKYWGSSASRTKLVAIEQPPKKEVADTGGPYAKRRAAKAESDLHYRGKNLGRPKVIGERRLSKKQKKALEKKQMWARLQQEDFGKTDS